MRTFVALEVPDAMREEAAALARQLRASVQGRFIPPENYHLTLAFLGNTSESDFPLIVDAMEQAASHAGEILLQPDGLGKFGRGEDATLWLGFAENPALMELAACLRNNLSERGIAFDGKPLRPHLTLARRARISKGNLPALPFPLPAPTQKATLFKSILGKDGAIYIPLHETML